MGVVVGPVDHYPSHCTPVEFSFCGCCTHTIEHCSTNVWVNTEYGERIFFSLDRVAEDDDMGRVYCRITIYPDLQKIVVMKRSVAGQRIVEIDHMDIINPLARGHRVERIDD